MLSGAGSKPPPLEAALQCPGGTGNMAPAAIHSLVSCNVSAAAVSDGPGCLAAAVHQPATWRPIHVGLMKASLHSSAFSWWPRAMLRGRCSMLPAIFARSTHHMAELYPERLQQIFANCVASSACPCWGVTHAQCSWLLMGANWSGQHGKWR